MGGVYVLSLNWRVAEAILRGVRRFEARPLAGPRRGGGTWRRPPIEEGSRVVMYATGPPRVRGLVGEFVASRVLVGPPREVLGSLDGRLYGALGGYSEVMVVEASSPCRYPRRIGLREIRAVSPGWQPPPGYRRLRPGEPLLRDLLEPLLAAWGRCGYSRRAS